MSSVRESYTIGGISIHAYRRSDSAAQSIAILFLLHGRHGSARDVESVARTLVEKAFSAKEQRRDLWVITLDHRNHGGRIVDANANNSWTEDPPNEQHALDMYAIQSGTAQDVSFLMDFIPAYLFPHGDRKVESWGAAGISLGGHSTWILLGQDERIQVGIPIIACPDYVELIQHRAKTSDLPFAAPYVPASFLKSIEKTNAASQNYASLERSNPFLGKKVLVLSGEEDRLVPWTASKKFVEWLEVGAGGAKVVVVEKGVGHECTERMLSLAAAFVLSELC